MTADAEDSRQKAIKIKEGVVAALEIHVLDTRNAINRPHFKDKSPKEVREAYHQVAKRVLAAEKDTLLQLGNNIPVDVYGSREDLEAAVQEKEELVATLRRHVNYTEDRYKFEYTRETKNSEKVVREYAGAKRALEGEEDALKRLRADLATSDAADGPPSAPSTPGLPDEPSKRHLQDVSRWVTSVLKDADDGSSSESDTEVEVKRARFLERTRFPAVPGDESAVPGEQAKVAGESEAPVQTAGHKRLHEDEDEGGAEVSCLRGAWLTHQSQRSVKARVDDAGAKSPTPKKKSPKPKGKASKRNKPVKAKSHPVVEKDEDGIEVVFEESDGEEAGVTERAETATERATEAAPAIHDGEAVAAVEGDL